MKKIKKGAEICSLEEIIFPVEIVDEEMNCNKEYSKRVIGIIDGEPKLLNQCSDVYKLIENSAIFPKIEEVLLQHNIEFTPTYRHTNNVTFTADYEITDVRYGYQMKNTIDVIRPMLRVQHSYNGLTKYKIVFGYFRLVCSNGLVIPVEEMKRFNLAIMGKHTEQVVKSFEELSKMLVYFSEEAAQITEAIVSKYEVLKSRVFANNDAVIARIEEVLKHAKISMVDNKNFNTVNELVATVTNEAGEGDGQGKMGYNGVANDWLIYNAINRYLNDDTRFISTLQTRMEKDTKVFEYMLQYA